METIVALFGIFFPSRGLGESGGSKIDVEIGGWEVGGLLELEMEMYVCGRGAVRGRMEI